jgi:hypothetical protein
MAEPRNAYTLSHVKTKSVRTELVHVAYDLVSGDEREGNFWQLTVHYVQIRSAHAAGRNPYPKFATLRSGQGKLTLH